MIKKILKIVVIVIVVISVAVVAFLIMLGRDPNMISRMLSTKIEEDQVETVAYTYDSEKTFNTKEIPLYEFTPTESANYRFSVYDIKNDHEILISMNAMDKQISDYFIVDNYDPDQETYMDNLSEVVALQESQPCYLMITAQPEDEDAGLIKGSFKVTITKDTGEEGPPVLTTEEPAIVEVGGENQSCAVFTPPETGYYIFDTNIVNARKSSGYSSLSSIKSSDNKKVEITSGVARLEQDKEYYVWASVYETSKKTSQVSIACSAMNLVQASGKCSIDITEDTVIEYKAEEAGNIAVYTDSDGDPKTIIYEEAGFPLRTDDNSEMSLSDNPDDIATVLGAAAGKPLIICVYGDIENCKVVITNYTGDGSSLTLDDVEPVETVEPADDEQIEESAETEEPSE